MIVGNVENPYPNSGYGTKRAFVSAEGAAYDAWTRNRGSGKSAPVEFVTSLGTDAETEGTLAYALQKPGARKVWPLVWGNVDSPQAIMVSSDTYYTNVFRPGTSKGLNLRNGVTTANSGAAGGVIADTGVSDVVLRFFRSHAGATEEQVAGLLSSNGLDWSTSGMNNFIARNGTTRIMLDHNNYAFSADQNTGSVGTNGLTLQHTWIQAPIDTNFHQKFFLSGTKHGMPVLYGYEDGNVSMHHTLISTGRERNPRVSDMVSGAVFDGRCNLVYNPHKWGPFFLHKDRHPGIRPNVNWSKGYWQPGPWTTKTNWLRLGSTSDQTGYPSVWLGPQVAEGFLNESQDPWNAGVDYVVGAKADYRKSTAHNSLPVREEDTPSQSRDFILSYGADRYVLDPNTFELKDTRDFVVKRTEADVRNGTGLNRGFDITDIHDSIYGYDQDFPSGSISKATFFSDYYNPWATEHGYPTGEAGFNSFDSATGYYCHDLYEAALTPHYPNLEVNEVPPPDTGEDIPNPFYDGVRAYPYRAFWPGSGSAGDYWTNDTEGFLNDLADAGYNASPAIPATLDAHYYSANQVASKKALVQLTVDRGMLPTTNGGSQNQARWREDNKYTEAFTMFHVPFKVTNGKLVPYNTSMYNVSLGNIEDWSNISGDVSWVGNTVTVTTEGQTSASKTITKTVLPGLYMLTADITVLSGAPDCQLYFRVQDGLAVADFISETGEIAIPVLVGADNSKVQIFARLRNSAVGSAKYDNVKLTPMHHSLKNVQEAMGGVRVFDTTGNPIARTVTITGSTNPTDPRNGSSCVINVSKPDNTQVFLDYESVASSDKLHLLNHPDAFQWWKTQELVPTSEVFEDHPPVLVLCQSPSEVRGYNRDARSPSYGKSNTDWLYDYIVNHMTTIRSVWPNVYIIFWDDMLRTSKNGAAGTQTGFGGKYESVSGLINKLGDLKGFSVVVWDYGASVESDSVEAIQDLIAAGIKPIAGPGQTATSVAAWLTVANPDAKAGRIDGLQYQEYHNRIDGYDDMSVVKSVLLT